MPFSDKIRWNQRYRERGPAASGLEPSDWLKTHEGLIDLQPMGPALDLACGNGRNALYLSRLGYEVEAVDISDVAIGWLEEKAASLQLSLHPRVMDLNTEQLPQKHYQIIMNFNFLERKLFPAIEAALAPGGLLFYETFTKDQIEILGATMPRRYTLEYNELIKAFKGLRILHYREGVFFERGKQKKRAVASLLAQK